MAGPKRILFAGSECFPLIKTGGLADVMGALPPALDSRGLEVFTLLPGFPAVKAGVKRAKKVGVLSDIAGGSVNILKGKSPTGQTILVADAPHLFDIDGNPYLDANGKDRADNGIRYAAFSEIAAKVALGQAFKWKADVVHAHDWQAGLVAAYLSLTEGPTPKTVFTIHNLAFQGQFPKSLMRKIGLPAQMFHQDGVEFWDKISFLKAGIIYSDLVTTVSPTYAREIQTEEGGMGLGGLLKKLNHKLHGIANGIDTEVWNPETDDALPKPFSKKAVAGKKAAKKSLLQHFGLSHKAKGPLFGVISRLTEQKGLDLVAASLPHIVGNDAQLVLLGSGDKDLEAVFEEAARNHPNHVGAFIGYDEQLAHQVQAGADVILVPSRFEPCGLTQLCAMRYGSVPLVARVGGLADTVIDASTAALKHKQGTGIQFSPAGFDPFIAGLDRALQLYQDKKTWVQIRRNGMREDVSWALPAAAYHALYQ
ncbi:MAG: glycogen synthase GlgA [Kordiimonadaceae bacterium]|nr:glycogen synthase GlgA [Kordiimonadaceae bacterium]MBO6567374.1 glycogen synthase GlgA [Kordiimonadaceae bacterium]MBO6963412.1 glycogen synthase GlgA [Kordiimonadaceae bacterium]